MSDYSLQVTWSTKDALATGQQLKAVSATELGNEFSAIATAVATKYDSDDISSEAEAEALTVNNKLITPLSLGQVLQDNAGIAYDFQQLADPAAHVLFGWDNTNNAAEAFTNATNGGITIGENTVAVNLNDLGTETSIATGDFLAMVDITDSGSQKITLANLITGINSAGTIDHDAATNFVADEHVAHSGVTLTAGTGLSGGGTIAASRTFNLDLNSLTNTLGATGAIDLDSDTIAGYDASATGTRKFTAAALVTPEVPSTITGTTDTLEEADFGKPLRYSSTSTVTVTLPNSLKTGFWCTLIKTGASGNLTISAATTLNTKNGLTTCSTQNGAITVLHVGSNVWYAWGDLES